MIPAKMLVSYRLQYNGVLDKLSDALSGNCKLAYIHYLIYNQSATQSHSFNFMVHILHLSLRFFTWYWKFRSEIVTTLMVLFSRTVYLLTILLWTGT